MSLILYIVIFVLGSTIYAIGHHCGSKATQERLMPIIDKLLNKNKELRNRLDNAAVHDICEGCSECPHNGCGKKDCDCFDEAPLNY